MTNGDARTDDVPTTGRGLTTEENRVADSERTGPLPPVPERAAGRERGAGLLGGEPLARLVLAAVSLLALLLGLIGLVFGLDVLRGTGMLVFLGIGLGSAPWQLFPELRLPARLSLTAVTALTVWTLPTTALEATGFWHPAPLTVALILLAAPLHGWVLQTGLSRGGRPRHAVPTGPAPRDAGLDVFAADPGTDLRADTMRTDTTRTDTTDELPAPALDARTEPVPAEPARPGLRDWRPDPIGWARTSWPVLLVAAGVLATVVAALTHRHLDPGFGGYLTQIGPVWYLGLVLVLAGFVLSRRRSEVELATAALGIMIVTTLTPALVYDGPRSQSAFKHVDLVQQVLSLGQVRASVEVYDSWPGLFAGGAWLSSATGIAPLTLSVLWPPLLGLARLVVLRHLAGQVLRDPFQRWVAVVLAVLADSIGADYFSPQSVGFVLGVGLFAIFLDRRLGSRRWWIVLVGGCALAVTHQLSPFVVGLTLVVLVVVGGVRPWWTPALVLGPAVLWTLAHLSSITGFLSLSALGRLSNFRPPQTTAASGLERLPIVTATVVALVLAVLIVGLLALVALIRDRQDRMTWALAVSPAAGLLLIAINPYGQEGVFRAALFGLPWLSVLAARLFHRHEQLRAGRELAVISTVLTAAFLVSNSGLDAFTVTRLADVRAVQATAADASGSTYGLLYLGRGDLPVLLRENAFLTGRGSLGNSEALVTSAPDADQPPATQVEDLTADFIKLAENNEVPTSELYAIWSPVMSTYGNAYGLLRPADFAAVRDAMDASPQWSPVYSEDGTVVFHLDPAAYRPGAP